MSFLITQQCKFFFLLLSSSSLWAYIHQCYSYRFALPRKDACLGLPIGQHVSVMAEINGKQVSRSYTPTTSDDDLGHFDLLIKVSLLLILPYLIFNRSFRLLVISSW